MEIKIYDFTLQPSDSTPDRFDLLRDGVGQRKKDGVKFTKKTTIGYAMSLESGIHTIISTRLAEKQTIVDLGTYVELYKREKEEVFGLLKQQS